MKLLFFILLFIALPLKPTFAASQNCFSYFEMLDTVSNTIGIVDPKAFIPPPSIPRQSGWLTVPHIRQEKMFCVPTSSAMVLAYDGVQISPRELKVWTRGMEYDPNQPFNDFTRTFFRDLISGLRNHGIFWTSHIFSNDDFGFSRGIQQIKEQIDGGHPVLVDTNLYTGHVFVVVGYDQSKDILIVRDPLIRPPGIREISNGDFSSIWNSLKGGPNVRAAVFTLPPPGMLK